jgi:hypothetical protein
VHRTRASARSPLRHATTICEPTTDIAAEQARGTEVDGTAMAGVWAAGMGSSGNVPTYLRCCFGSCQQSEAGHLPGLITTSSSILRGVRVGLVTKTTAKVSTVRAAMATGSDSSIG